MSGSTARTAASLVGVNKSTAAFTFIDCAMIIALESEDASPPFGEIEVEESYFGGKIRVFGAAAQTRLQGLCESPDQPLQTVLRSKNDINGIENFWNQAKRHIRRFNDIPVAHFHLYLKECEWRQHASANTTTNPVDSMGYKSFQIVI